MKEQTLTDAGRREFLKSGIALGRLSHARAFGNGAGCYGGKRSRNTVTMVLTGGT
jgi:hypothetical protein